MMPGSWLDCAIAKNGTTSAEVDLGRPYEKMLVVIPAIDAAVVNITVAEKSGGTFQDLYVTNVADGANKKVAAADGEGSLTWLVPLGGFQYVKAVASNAQTTQAVTLRVCGVRS